MLKMENSVPPIPVGSFTRDGKMENWLLPGFQYTKNPTHYINQNAALGATGLKSKNGANISIRKNARTGLKKLMPVFSRGDFRLDLELFVG